MNSFKIYFWDVIKNHYLDFNGVATRKQFWLFVLWNFIISAIIILIGYWFYNSSGDDTTSIISNILGFIIIVLVYNLLVLLPHISITARRLHDAGFSAWLLLLNFVPYIGMLVIFIMLVLPSKLHNNKYLTTHHQ